MAQVTLRLDLESTNYIRRLLERHRLGLLKDFNDAHADAPTKQTIREEIGQVDRIVKEFA